MEPLTIAQISDIHIPKNGDKPFDVDVRENFKKQIEGLKDETFDILVVSGDLCHKEGNASIYKWVKKQLDSLSKPYYIIPGNHDNPANLAKIFDFEDELEDEELFYIKEYKGIKLIFLDSGKGWMKSRQMDWLKNILPEKAEEVYIFMHHPPIISEVPHMDNQFAFENMDDFQEIIFNTQAPVEIFTGHYHIEKVLRKKNMTVYITPSPFFNLDDRSEDFKIEHHRIGWRKIVLYPDQVLTSIRYIN